MTFHDTDAKTDRWTPAAAAAFLAGISALLWTAAGAGLLALAS